MIKLRIVINARWKHDWPSIRYEKPYYLFITDHSVLKSKHLVLRRSFLMRVESVSIAPSWEGSVYLSCVKWKPTVIVDTTILCVRRWSLLVVLPNNCTLVFQKYWPNIDKYKWSTIHIHVYFSYPVVLWIKTFIAKTSEMVLFYYHVLSRELGNIWIICLFRKRF